MLLEKIILEGFLSYQERQEVNVDEVKTCLVLGRINDDIELSNGAGKSSLFEAIPVNFFGKGSGRADLLDSYINDKMSKMYIEIIFKIDNQRYKTIRTKSRNSSGSFEVFLDSTNKEINNSTWKKCDKTVEDILGLSSKTYSSTIYLNERESLQIITGTSSERKEILRELLNIEVYEKACKLCNKKFDDIDKKVQVNLNLIKDKQEQLEFEDETNQKYKSLEAILRKSKTSLKLKLKELDKEKDKKQKLNVLIETENIVKNQITQVNKEIDETNEQHRNLLDDIRNVVNEVKEQTNIYNKRKKSVEDSKEEKVKVEQIIIQHEQKLKELDEVDLKLKKLNDDIKKVKQQKVDSERIIEVTETQQKPIEVLLKRFEKFDNICPITEIQCDVIKGDFGDKLKKEKQKELLKLQKIIDGAEEELKNINCVLEKHTKEQRSLDIEVYSRQQVNNSLSKARLNLQSFINTEISFKEKEELFFKYIEDSKKEEKDLIDKSKKIEEKLKEKNKFVEELNKKIDCKLQIEFNKIQETIIEIENDYESLRCDIDNLNQEIGEFKNKIDMFEKMKLDINHFTKTNEDFMKQKKIFQILSTVFGKDGIQKSIMKETIPMLEKYSAEFLKIFNEDSDKISVKFDLDPKKRDGELKKGGGLDILVLEEDKEPKDLQMYSGGETVRIVFSIVLSLAKLLSFRAGKKHETLIIDEKIAKLDAKGISQFGEVISEISKIYNQVFIITHIESLKDLISGNEIIVNKTDEGSLVTVI